MKTKITYPIVLEFYLISIIFFNAYVFISVSSLLKLYSMLVFLIAVNGLINSINNYNLQDYNGAFCALDTLEYTLFLLMTFSILYEKIALFWLMSFIVQSLYIPWNIIYLKTTSISPYAARRIRQYSVLDGISALISLSVFVIKLVFNFNDLFLLFGLFSWVIILGMWALDNFSLGSKLDLPGQKILLYDVMSGSWRSVKSINTDNHGIITEIKLGEVQVEPDPNTEYYMLPGLIDSHVHIDQNPYIDEKIDTLSEYEIALNNINEAIESGITTICDMGGKQINNYYTVNRLKKMHENLAHIETCGCFCSKRYGHYMQHDGFVVDDKQSASIFSNYVIKLGLKYVKIMLGKYEMSEDELDELLIAGIVTDKRIQTVINEYNLSGSKIEHDKTFYECLSKINQLQAYTLEELFQIVSEFNNRDLIVFAHAFEEKDVYDAIEAGITRIEHVGDYSDDLILQLKERKVIVTSTFVAAEDGTLLPAGLPEVSAGCTTELIKKWYYDTRVTLPKLYKYGVKVSLGTDSGFQGTPFCSLIREIISLVSDLGIQPRDVLKSATIVGAEKLALNRGNCRIGELTPKAYADFVLYEKNFIDDIDVMLNPAQVWIRGELVYERKYD